MPILHKSHGVGSLAFAADGTLLATTGDGASYDDTDVGEATNDDPNIHTNTYYIDALADGIITRKEDVGRPELIRRITRGDSREMGLLK